jgi:radical SAM protein with 4Fe4S-binding SPASM domain
MAAGVIRTVDRVGLRAPFEVLGDSEQLAAFLGDVPILAASLRLTAMCNASCPFCYSNARAKLPDELTREEWQRIAEQLAAAGVLRFFLTGGEPALVPWLEPFIAQLPRDVFVAMSSNGTGITPGRLVALAAAGLRHLQLSVDSVGDSHDRRRGLPGSFVANLRLLASSDELRRRGLTLGVATLIASFNIGELDRMLDLLADAGCRRWVLVPLCRAGRQADDTALAPIGSTLRTIERLARRAAELRDLEVVPLLPPALVPRTGVPPRYQLGFVAPFPNQVAVAANGDFALADVLLDHRDCVLGNARRDPVVATVRRAVSQRPEAAAWNASAPPGICARCVHADVCAGGDRASSFLLDGTAQQPDRMCRAADEAGCFPRESLAVCTSGRGRGIATRRAERVAAPAERCVVVRHALCEDNVAGLLPRPTSGLTAQGRRDAERVAARLAARPWPTPLRCVVTSPMARSRDTAEVIARALGLPVKEDARLREVDFGAATGLTPVAFRSAFPDLVAPAEDVASPDFRWPEGERRGDLFLRAIAACDEYCSAAHAGAVLVTHWTVSGIVIAHHGGDHSRWPDHALGTAEYRVLCGDPGTTAAMACSGDSDGSHDR